MNEVLERVEELHKEARVFHEKGTEKEMEAQALMKEFFGLEDGEVLTATVFVKAIGKIIDLKNESP